MNSARPLFMPVALLALACATAAWAGQVRVNASGFSFIPADVSANQGDHIVWVFTGGAHTVTSGTVDLGGNGVPDGRFDTGGGPAGLPVFTTFSWKSNRTGTQEYYCIPHLPSMVGSITLAAAGTTGQSDFRITEVLAGAAGNLDLVEITNLGTGAGNLGMYRLKIPGVAPQTLQKVVGTSSGTNLFVAAGGRLVVHVNASGTNSDTTVYLPGVADLPATGSLALYVPNTVNTNLADASQLIDFVQWGAGGQENEATAVAAGFWAPNATAPAVAAGHSIEFCGQPGQYGAARWYDNPTPNFAAGDNCAVPTFNTTWGRLKTLYR